MEKIFKPIKISKSNFGAYGDLISTDDIKSIDIIGDANAPGPIAWATYAGHRYARELDTENLGDVLPFRREVTNLASN